MTVTIGSEEFNVDAITIVHIPTCRNQLEWHPLNLKNMSWLVFTPEN
jgi:hypothetical protein